MKLDKLLIFSLLILCTACFKKSPVHGEESRIERVKKLEIYFFQLATTPRIPNDIKDLKRGGYILINKKREILREAIREFKSLKRSSISLNEMDFQMYLVFYYSNGQKDRVAFDRNNRIFLNGVTYEKNPNLVKKLINCLPKGFSDVWMERKFRDF